MTRGKTGRSAEGGGMPAIRSLLAAQRVAVLGTHCGGQPHSGLVAFAASPDGKSLLFATLRATRKFRNLLADPRASLLIDDRADAPSDLEGVTAVTAVGRVVEVAKGPRGRLARQYLARHPQLAVFLQDPDCALFRMKVARYVLVTRFQHVEEVSPMRCPGRRAGARDATGSGR